MAVALFPGAYSWRNNVCHLSSHVFPSNTPYRKRLTWQGGGIYHMEHRQVLCMWFQIMVGLQLKVYMP